MRHTKSAWRQLVASWRASGQTAEEFAAAHGVAAATLRWWTSRLKREEPPPAAPLVRMAQVIRSPAPAIARGAVIVDALDLRVRITIEASVERETVDMVFGALGVGGPR
jgi:hypothetical protein